MIRDRELGRLADAVLIPPFPGHTPPEWILSALESGLAGVTLFGPNVSDPEQISLLTSALRGSTDEPVIAIDEEGGDVTRVTYWSGSLYPGNAALGAIDDPELTERVHRAIGTDLAMLGINVDLAPCVDVLDEAENPAIGTRSFGSDPALVSRHAAAAVLGLQAAGVAATAKHFPGHGSTRSDTHEVIASISGDLAEVWRRDLPPFQAAIAAGAAAIMPGHLRLPELTGELPASLSPAAMTGLLRGELGFSGVIISDALEMRAVSRRYGIAEAAVMAIIAGVDLLCLGRDTSEEVYHAIVAALSGAVRAGRLPADRLEDAADRVARLRTWLAASREARSARSAQAASGLAASGPAANGQGGNGQGANGRAGHGTAGHGQAGHGQAGHGQANGSQIGLQAARRAVQLSGDRPVLTDPVIVEVEPRGNVAVGRAAWGLAPWAPVRRVAAAPLAVAVAGAEDHVAPVPIPLEEGEEPAEEATAADILAAATGRSLVLVVRDAHRSPATQDLVTSVLAERPDAVLVEMGLPEWRPPAGTYGAYLATWGAARVNAQAAAEVLGLIPA